jgi:hypothetical protein
MIIKANPGFKAVFVRDRNDSNKQAWLEYEDIIAWEILENETPIPITIKHGNIAEKRNHVYLCIGIKNEEGQIITGGRTYENTNSYLTKVNKNRSWGIDWGVR